MRKCRGHAVKCSNSPAYGLHSLRNIVKVGMGFTALSKAVGIPAPNLHRALSMRGNPTIKTLNKIVSAIAASLGVDLAA